MKTSKNMNNQQIAQLLKAVSAALLVKGENQFRVQAYDRAAVAIEHATSEVKDLWDDGQLTSLPGVGASIAQHLDELFRTGRVKHFEEIFKGLPEAMFELIQIPGIGPKSAYKLCKALGITKARNAIKKLEKAAKDGEVRKIEGFGEESERDILQNIAEFHRRENRMLLSFAENLAQKIAAYLKKEPAVLRVEPLGSLRRRCATIGDLDLAVATNQPEKVVDHFLRFPQVKQVLNKGSRKASVVLFNGRQVDLRVQEEASFGALLQYFTGSKQHNIALRTLAQKRHLSLSEYGIKKVNGKEKLFRFKTEKAFYNFLGLDWIPPELREDTGEIEAAQKHQLPQLVTPEDIKGDLHIHSDFDVETSHDLGQDGLEKILSVAADLGYEYIAIADHTPSTSQHTSQQIIDLLKRRREYYEQIIYSREKSENKRTIKVFISLEIDILPDGRLAIPEKAFDYLDFAIVSVHSSFRLSRQKMTHRVLTALAAHPKIKILGHPTGRLLNEREGYELDWEALFDLCQKKEKFLEVNAWPNRLDLPDTLVREAVKNGVKLVINTDSHAADQLRVMPYGVYTARRGWAEKKDILNTLSLAELEKKLGV